MITAEAIPSINHRVQHSLLIVILELELINLLYFLVTSTIDEERQN